MPPHNAVEHLQLAFNTLGRQINILTPDNGTVTAVAGAATLNKIAGVVTTAALSTAAGGTYTLTLTNSEILAADLVMVSVDANGSAGTPTVASVEPAAGSVVIIIQNIHSADAFDSAIKIMFMTFTV